MRACATIYSPGPRTPGASKGGEREVAASERQASGKRAASSPPPQRRSLPPPPQVAGAERLIWRQGSTDCLGKVTFDRCQV